MKILLAIGACVALAIFTMPYVVASTEPDHQHVTANDIVEHGGGCRKSSPAGMCCHMDNSVGRVHCH